MWQKKIIGLATSVQSKKSKGCQAKRFNRNRGVCNDSGKISNRFNSPRDRHERKL